MTENEKKLEQAKHRLIVHGAALENVFPDTKAMSEEELKSYLSNLIKN